MAAVAVAAGEVVGWEGVRQEEQRGEEGEGREEIAVGNHSS